MSRSAPYFIDYVTLAYAMFDPTCATRKHRTTYPTTRMQHPIYLAKHIFLSVGLRAINSGKSHYFLCVINNLINKSPYCRFKNI
ncbi:hypothetical protein PUN28_016779 [Cardiocondyla obscurior]|uniref:Uncharacterized protein n=1 Tax=Cardiocondyla obscurior TaxID=286306 RepID=A0AAW2ENT3_9HYME